MAVLNPITPIEAEAAIIGFFNRLIATANEAEELAEYAAVHFTEESLNAGNLIALVDAEGNPVAWTVEQLKAAQDMYEQAKKFSEWMRKTNGNSEKATSPLQRLQRMRRAGVR
jgi:hypothetical protein